MFAKKPQHEYELDKVINKLLLELPTFDADTEEYAAVVTQLERLYKLKDDNRSKQVSPDTLAIVAGNLLGILIIVGYEHAHVATSKALSFVLKAH